MKTIKQIADEIGVTKQAIRRHVDKLPPTLISTGDNNSILINPEGESKIKEWVSPKINIVDTNKVPIVDSVNTNIDTNEVPTVDSVDTNVGISVDATIQSLISTLQQQLDVKDQQIQVLQQSLSDTTKALLESQQTAKAAQALHAGTMQQQLTSGVDENIVDEHIKSDMESDEPTRRSWWPFSKRK